MNTATMTPEEMTHKAQELRQRARISRERMEESFQRCDTDGFLTQWSHDITARLHDAQVKILEDNGKATFAGLYEGQRRVKAKVLEGDWGPFWLLDDSEIDLIQRRGRNTLPCGERSRVQKQLGLHEALEHDFAWALRASGRSGSCFVRVICTGDEWGQTATPVS